METDIRASEAADVDEIVGLSLRAWAPVFDSMEATLGPRIFRELFGQDWREHQERDVRRACEEHLVSVAAADGSVVGSRLTQRAIDQIRRAGKRMVVVGTGGDPGHAPARATYAKAGFRNFPSEQYYLMLE